MSSQSKALIVDDDEPIRNMIRRVLERDGFAVETATNGQEAIDLLEGKEYDFVVLDLMMPRVDGYGVLRYLREHSPQSLRKVVIATAVDSADDVRREPVAGILRKPFDLRDLRSLAHRFLSPGDELPA
ncbi:MAG TPA: response regulator [Thermoanaerobaculia bacterium]|nr:response regulator [Thermoanaerobaculia bacterium]